MSGGLMQLVAYGAQDVYITGNPHITFFKLVYRRHTNFAIEGMDVSLPNADFGRQTNVVIPRSGDLVGEMYLVVTLDKLVPSDGALAGWVRRVGHALLQQVDILIGGTKIDRHYGFWLDVWHELARNAGDTQRGYLKMIGDVPELTKYDGSIKEEYQLYIPLQFWFNRHVGLALPMIALQYHELRLDITFRRVEELLIANECFRQCDLRNVRMKDAILLVNYIYLDAEERKKFAQVGHEYLIEQLQFNTSETISSYSGKFKLDFNHPTKELIWFVQNDNYVRGEQFPFYTHHNNWECSLDMAASKILEESIYLGNGPVSESDPYGSDSSVSIQCDQPPCNGTWEKFPAGSSGITANGKITVFNDSCNKILWVNTDSLMIKCGGYRGATYSLTDKISADIKVTQNAEVIISNISTTLSVRDLSFPTKQFNDSRVKKNDPFVYQWHNYGILIDGSKNPIESVQIYLNNQERFHIRRGDYFNYVQPYERHTNTPADGINVYSFAIKPEEHQPSGTCNLSRIDNMSLAVSIKDKTHRVGLPELDFINNDNRFVISGVNYNILRIMSGMGGLAYSN